MRCTTGYTFDGRTCVKDVCPLGDHYVCSGTPKQCVSPAVPITSIQELTYTYDRKGNIKTVIDAVNGITHTHDYDGLDRLATATGTGSNGYAQSYSYDALGNIT